MRLIHSEGLAELAELILSSLPEKVTGSRVPPGPTTDDWRSSRDVRRDSGSRDPARLLERLDQLPSHEVDALLTELLSDEEDGSID